MSQPSQPYGGQARRRSPGCAPGVNLLVAVVLLTRSLVVGIIGLVQSFIRGFTEFVNKTFRLLVLLVLFIVYTMLIILFTGVPATLPQAWLERLVFPVDTLAAVFSSLFAPRVMVYTLPFVAAAWLAYRLAAHYLADLFELKRFSTATQYVQAAVFGVNLPRLSIKHGDMNRLDRDNPLVRIGGPGHIGVDLGFAAVVEQTDATPVVLPGDRRGGAVGNFERIREIVDLRDLLRQVPEIRVVTADGIELRANDVEVLFRIREHDSIRDRRRALDGLLSGFHAFDREDICRVVYGRRVTDQEETRWTTLPPGLTTQIIRRYVSRHRLEDLLALAEWRLEGDSRPIPNGQNGDFFIPRSHLTEEVYESSAADLAGLGLSLVWVGVGTWRVLGWDPAQEKGRLVGDTLLKAWIQWQQAKAKSQEAYLDSVASAAEGYFAEAVIQDLIKAWEKPDLGRFGRCLSIFAVMHGFLIQKGIALYGEGGPPGLDGLELVEQFFKEATKPLGT